MIILWNPHPLQTLKAKERNIEEGDENRGEVVTLHRFILVVVGHLTIKVSKTTPEETWMILKFQITSTLLIQF